MNQSPCLVALTIALASFHVRAQTPTSVEPAVGHGLPGRKPGTEQWLVQFRKRSFDVSQFRRAMHQGQPWAAVAKILATYQLPRP